MGSGLGLHLHSCIKEKASLQSEHPAGNHLWGLQQSRMQSHPQLLLFLPPEPTFFACRTLTQPGSLAVVLPLMGGGQHCDLSPSMHTGVNNFQRETSTDTLGASTPGEILTHAITGLLIQSLLPM